MAQRYSEVEGHVETKTESGVVLPQAKECLEPPEAGRGTEGFCPGAFRGNVALQTPWLQPSDYRAVRVNFCCV